MTVVDGQKMVKKECIVASGRQGKYRVIVAIKLTIHGGILGSGWPKFDQ